MKKPVLSIAIGFAVATLLYGCATHEDTYYRNIETNKQVFLGHPALIKPHTFKGVFIDFPAIGEWYLFAEHGELFAASQHPTVHLYTTALLITVVHPPKASFSNNEEFISAAKAATYSDHYQEVERFKLETTEGQGRWQGCLKYYKKFSTTDSSNAPNALLYQEEAGYLCQHPYKPGLFLRIDYSERYPSELNVVQFAQRNEQIMDNIRFER